MKQPKGANAGLTNMHAFRKIFTTRTAGSSKHVEHTRMPRPLTVQTCTYVPLQTRSKLHACTARLCTDRYNRLCTNRYNRLCTDCYNRLRTYRYNRLCTVRYNRLCTVRYNRLCIDRYNRLCTDCHNRMCTDRYNRLCADRCNTMCTDRYTRLCTDRCSTMCTDCYNRLCSGAPTFTSSSHQIKTATSQWRSATCCQHASPQAVAVCSKTLTTIIHTAANFDETAMTQ